MIIDHADSCMNVPFMLWRAIDHIWKMLIIAMNRHWSCMITYIFISSWTLSWPLGSGESDLPLSDTFSPSGSLVRHQIWFQTPHNGQTGQYSLGRHHRPISGLLGPFWRLSEGHFLSKSTLLGTLETPKIPFTGSINAFHLLWPPRWSIIWYFRLYLVFRAIWWPFQRPKGRVWDYLKTQKGYIF